MRSGVPTSTIFNSGRAERAHCAKPKPFIDPGMSISLKTTSNRVLVLCRRNGLVCTCRFNDVIAAVAEELHDGHADQDITVQDQDGLNGRALAVAVGHRHARILPSRRLIVVLREGEGQS
jgi:hypothetical protein